MKILQNNLLFIMIDIQEKFSNVISHIEDVVKNAVILNKSAEILSIPLIITEQYPKGLGKTLDSIYVPNSANIFEKSSFSAATDDVINCIKNSKKTQIVLYGVETHICLTQTALTLKEMGYDVIMIADAVSSRKDSNKEIALKRLIQNNIEIVSTEMLLFEILQNSKHPGFKQISALIK